MLEFKAFRLQGIESKNANKINVFCGYGVPVFGGKSPSREVYFADYKSASQNGP
jgi:hypothetical protein